MLLKTPPGSSRSSCRPPAAGGSWQGAANLPPYPSCELVPVTAEHARCQQKSTPGRSVFHLKGLSTRTCPRMAAKALAASAMALAGNAGGGGTQLLLVTAPARSRRQADVRANRDTADVMPGAAAGAGEGGLIGSLWQAVPKARALRN